jgi:hypothetical protein
VTGVCTQCCEEAPYSGRQTRGLRIPAQVDLEPEASRNHPFRSHMVSSHEATIHRRHRCDARCQRLGR